MTSKWLLFASGTLMAALLGGCATRDLPPRQLQSPYNRPLVSPGTMFANLPPTVQRTIRAQAGAAQIVDVARLRAGSDTAYKILFEPPALYSPLYVAADGSVLNPDLSVAMGAPSDEFDTLSGAETSTSNLQDFLPPQVLDALRNRAPLKEIVRVSRQPWGERSLYVVTFQDQKVYPTLYVTSEGTVLSDNPN
jgi:hypothetical protein